MLAAIAEVLAHRRPRVGRQKLHRRGIGSGSFDHNCVIHRTEILERLHDLRDRRSLLADGHVNANNILAALIDDRVNGDCGFSSLTITNDQFALAPADRHHRIDRFQSGWERLFHRLAIDNSRRNPLDRVVIFGDDRSALVDGISQRIHDATHERLAHGHLHNAAGAFDEIAFFDLLKLAEEHHANFVFFEIECQAAYVVRKLEQLAGHNFLQAMNLRDAVADLDHGTDFHDGDAGFKVFDLLANDFVNFVGFYRLHDSILDFRFQVSDLRLLFVFLFSVVRYNSLSQPLS